MTDNSLSSRKKELAIKYGINFEKLENEQLKLVRNLTIKDKIDPLLIENYGAIDTIFIKNKILCCFIVCNKNFEEIDRSYFFDKVRFPYFPGFRSYRELPSMIAAFEKLNERPDVVFISGQGIIHPRLGIASHFSLMTGIPAIGVSDSLFECEINGELKDSTDILRDGKNLGKVLISKEGSNPMFISPGNDISVTSAYELSKKTIIPPHKRPEPLHMASKYAKKVKKELALSF